MTTIDFLKEYKELLKQCNLKYVKGVQQITIDRLKLLHDEVFWKSKRELGK